MNADLVFLGGGLGRQVAREREGIYARYLHPGGFPSRSARGG